MRGVRATFCMTTCARCRERDADVGKYKSDDPADNRCEPCRIMVGGGALEERFPALAEELSP